MAASELPPSHGRCHQATATATAVWERQEGAPEEELGRRAAGPEGVSTSPPATPAATAPFEAFSLLLGAPRHCSVLPWQHMTGWLHHAPSPVLVKSGNPDGTFACRYSSALPWLLRGCSTARAHGCARRARLHQRAPASPVQLRSAPSHLPRALPQARQPQPGARACAAGSAHPHGRASPPRCHPCSWCRAPHRHCQLLPRSHGMLSALVYPWSLSPHWGASHNHTPVNKPYVLQSWEAP